MNGKAGYEQTITGKLEALPLPDMADAIWNRIERELDTDLPTDDGGTEGPSGPSFPKGLVFGSLSSLFVFSLLAYFFLIKKPEPQTIPNSQPKEPTSIQTKLPDSKPPDPPRTSNTLSPSTDKKDNPAQFLAPRPDSVFTAISNPPADTAAGITNPPPDLTLNIPPQVSQPDTPSKKKRGVSGLSDKDYRITPKKDQE